MFSNKILKDYFIYIYKCFNFYSPKYNLPSIKQNIILKSFLQDERSTDNVKNIRILELVFFFIQLFYLSKVQNKFNKKSAEFSADSIF